MLTLGLCLIVVGGFESIQAHSNPTFDGAITTIQVSKTNSKPPVELNLKSISRTLPIKQTIIQENKWEIYEDGASHLSSSSNPGDIGNIILYGHNTPDRLGFLNKVKIGDEIILKNSDGITFSYKVNSIKTVNPSDIGELTRFTKETLTIYTCTGFADLKRLVVKAVRVNNTPTPDIQ